MSFCPRTIVFTIPGNPPVQITAVENAGSIDFTVDVLNDAAVLADLRGLFFHFQRLDGLVVSGGDGLITGTKISSNSVINLGQGVEMNGAASPFDVGIKWGTPGPSKDDINFPVHFTLSNAANDLTLDDFGGLEFGARLDSLGGPGGPRGGVAKITTVAPFAPDAVDDAFPIFEDGASGLNDPSTIPTGVLFDVLANDEDQDGDTLIITDVDGALHGTVQIVDGDDLDLLPGDAILYTPNEDYSGTDTFNYCVSDQNGGQDNANVDVTITAVADVPDLDIEVVQGAHINEYIINVTATQTDFDSSEFIDRIITSVAGGLPAGVTIDPLGTDPGGEPDELFQQFLVTVPTEQDILFDLDFTAFSREVSNGDEEQATETVRIEVDFTHNTTQQSFSTTNQSIWDPSLPGEFNDNRFVGIGSLAPDGSVVPVSDSASLDIEIAEVGGSYSLALGLQSTLHATLGDIEATLPYNITIDTTYNVTTDSLLIDPTALLDSSAFFSTEGPGGSYSLDFVFLASLSAFFHPLIGPNLDAGVGPLDLGFNLLGIDSDELTIDIHIPPLNPVATLTVSWPQVDTDGTVSGPTTLHSDGVSNDIVNLDVDVIALALAALGISPNPLDLGFVNLVGLNVNGGVNLAQHFDLNSVLDAALTFEDGVDVPFEFGSELPIISNVSSHDANGDGVVEFGLHLTPVATLENETGLNFHIGGDISILDFDPGPTLFEIGADLDLGEITIYNPDPFALGGFNSQNYQFLV
jgi:Bacterial Ig domain